MEYYLVAKISFKYLNIKQKLEKKWYVWSITVLLSLCLWMVACKSKNSFTEDRGYALFFYCTILLFHAISYLFS